MIHFNCPRCNAAFQYPDAMAGNKIRCTGPNCNQKLLVPPSNVPDAVAVPAAPVAPIAPSGPSEPLWNYLENGQSRGPVAVSELKRLVASGRLKPRDPVWSTGMGDWRPLQEAMPALFREPADGPPLTYVGPRKAVRRDGHKPKAVHGSLYEKIGIGVFGVVAAAILVGLFMFLFPLIQSSAAKMANTGPTTEQPPKDAKRENSDLVEGQPYQKVLRSCVWILASDGKSIWSGSGSLFDREQRLVLTNQHVANETCKEILVMFPALNDEKQLITERSFYVHGIKKLGIAAELVKSDPTRDLAVIQLEKVPDEAIPIRMAKESVSPGQAISSIGGNPAGNDQGMWILSEGKVRQVYHLQWNYGDGFSREADIIASNLGINHGDSGGPVYDSHCRLVGVNAMGDDTQQNAKHIDIREVREFLPRCYTALGKAWKDLD